MLVRWSLREIWYGVGPKAYISDVGKYKYCLLPLIFRLYENRNLPCVKPKAKWKVEFLEMFPFQKKNQKCTYSIWTHTAIIVKQESSWINTQKFFISAEMSEDLLILCCLLPSPIKKRKNGKKAQSKKMRKTPKLGNFLFAFIGAEITSLLKRTELSYCFVSFRQRLFI